MILFWFIVAAIIILSFQGWLFKRFVLQRISYERRFEVKTCFRGDEVDLIEQLSNSKWLPVPWLRVESQLSTYLRFRKQENFAVSSGDLYQNHKSFFSLTPYTKITRKHRITPVRRGWYKLHTVTVTGGDLLGINSCSLQIPLNSELIVYPKPAEVPTDQLPYHSWQGDQSVRRWIISDPFVIAGTRDYQPGDTYKQVNWKATAKTGRLQVHQHDFTADRRLMIYLNVDDAEGMWRNVTDEAMIERGIEWAAGAAEAVIHQGMEVGFSANMPLVGEKQSVHIELGSGHEHLLGLYEVMSKLVLERTELFSQLLEQAAHSGYSERDVLVITSYWNDTMEQHVQRLRYNGNAVAIWLLTDQSFASESTDSSREEAVWEVEA